MLARTRNREAGRRASDPRDALSRWAPRLLPVFVAFYVMLAPILVRGGVVTGIVGLLALPLLLVAARHIERSILILVALMPFQTVVLSWLYSLGLPAELVANLRYWRDLLVVAILIGVLARRADADQRMDALDRVAIAYILVVAAYVALPRFLAPDAPLRLDTRLSGFRQNAGFLVLFLAVRRAPLDRAFRDRFVRVVLVVTAIVSAVAIFEFFNSSTFNDWMVNRLQVTKYLLEVLNSPVLNPLDIRFYGDVGDRQIIRVGSVLLSPLTFPFYVVPGFVLGLEHLLRRKRDSLAAVATVLAGLGIVFSQTRSAVLTAVVALALALRLDPRSGGERRTRLAILLGAALIVSLPIAASIGLVDRVRGGGDSGSATIHRESGELGWETLAQKPLGLGLGTSAGVGLRFNQYEIRQIQHNSYLQIGNETGALSLALLVAILVLVGMLLREIARSPGDPLSMAACCSLAGFAVGSWLLQPFVEPAVAWQYFLVAGVAVAVARRPTAPGDSGAGPIAQTPRPSAAPR
ncbi:MAG: O-antigen ligase family protein [Acidimicrobiales bacterium]